MFVIDIKTERLEKVLIQIATNKELKIASKEFDFNWFELSKEYNSVTYIIKFFEQTEEILGLLHLINNQGMLVMNLVEVSPNNIGKKKEYDFIAGCLIAFACKKSFELDSSYKGFLTFNAKSELLDLYSTKYYAKQINGQRMYIEPEFGLKLIDQYLNRKK